MIGTQELILIGIALVLIFGAKRIPDIARSIGSGIKEFKKALSTHDTHENEEDVYKLKEKNVKNYNARKKKTSRKKK
ncbi:MAG: twin-arginine translocase TatA/TatE family subunit [Spirochaetes bacterium]|nr:twin-arginine translocase TatA/TatE family subunit [Spirochaetota bacterium]